MLYFAFYGDFLSTILILKAGKKLAPKKFHNNYFQFIKSCWEGYWSNLHILTFCCEIRHIIDWKDFSLITDNSLTMRCQHKVHTVHLFICSFVYFFVIPILIVSCSCRVEIIFRTAKFSKILLGDKHATSLCSKNVTTLCINTLGTYVMYLPYSREY